MGRRRCGCYLIRGVGWRGVGRGRWCTRGKGGGAEGGGRRVGADKWGRERKGPGGWRGEVVRKGRGESIVGGGKVRGEVVSWGAAVARIVVGLPVHSAIWYLTVCTPCPNVHGTIVTAAQNPARRRGHLDYGEIEPIPGGGTVRERLGGKQVGGRGRLTYG